MKKRIYIVFFFVFIIDLLSKFVISKTLVPLREYFIIPKLFYICSVNNSGGAWSIMSGYTIIFILIAIGVLYYIFKYIIIDNMSILEELSFILLIGGIVGNLFDRIIYGYVIDFIGFIIFGYRFPIFNIADICICIGAILLIIDLFRGGRNEVRSK